MLAVKGIYENGRVTLENKPSIEMSEVVVVFPDSESKKREEELALEKKRELFNEFSGSVSRVIDVKVERFEALDEKYESID